MFLLIIYEQKYCNFHFHCFKWTESCRYSEGFMFPRSRYALTRRRCLRAFKLCRWSTRTGDASIPRALRALVCNQPPSVYSGASRPRFAFFILSSFPVTNWGTPDRGDVRICPLVGETPIPHINKKTWDLSTKNW